MKSYAVTQGDNRCIIYFGMHPIHYSYAATQGDNRCIIRHAPDPIVMLPHKVTTGA